MLSCLLALSQHRKKQRGEERNGTERKGKERKDRSKNIHNNVQGLKVKPHHCRNLKINRVEVGEERRIYCEENLAERETEEIPKMVSNASAFAVVPNVNVSYDKAQDTDFITELSRVLLKLDGCDQANLLKKIYVEQ